VVLDTSLKDITRNLQDHIFSSTDFNRHKDRLEMAESILQTLSVGVVVANATGLITYVNARGLEILEQDKDAVIGMPSTSLIFFGSDYAKARKAKAQLLKNGTWEGKLITHTPAGHQKTIQYYASVLYDAEGGVKRMIASMVDISKQKENNSTKSFRADMLQYLPDAVVAVDATQHIRFWNSKAAQMYGWKAEEALGNPVSIISPDVQYYDEQMQEIASGEVWRQLEEKNFWKGKVKQQRKDKKNLLLSASLTALRNADADLIGHIGIYADLKAHATYQQTSEEYLKLEAALENTDNAVFFIDRQSRLLHFNAVFAAGLLRNMQKHITEGMSMFEILPEELHQLWEQFHAYAVSGKKMTVEESVKVSGKESFYRVHISPIKNPEGEIISICYAARRLQLNESNLPPSASQQYDTQRTYEQGVLDERKRVGMELHDGVGQQISALQMRLNYMMSRDLSATSELQNLQDELKKVHEEIRRISHDMMPQLLEKYGLEDALLLVLQEVRETNGIGTDFNLKLCRKKYPDVVEKTLYRIVQELVNNTVKHTQAEHIFLNIVEDSNVLRVIYQDNGNFIARKEDKAGRGLLNIRQRISSLGGTVKIKSKNNNGFHIYFKLPL
jgi:PAS domain S-box-containing protein